MKRLWGFSLVELMVVIAIVAILAAVAVPVYKDYITKVRIHNAIKYMRDCAAVMYREFNATGAWPASVCGVTGGSVLAVSPIPEIVEVHYGPASATRAYFRIAFNSNLVPGTDVQRTLWDSIGITNTNSLGYVRSCGEWNAGFNTAYRKFLPSNCNSTTVDADTNY